MFIRVYDFEEDCKNTCAATKAMTRNTMSYHVFENTYLFEAHYRELDFLRISSNHTGTHGIERALIEAGLDRRFEAQKERENDPMYAKRMSSPILLKRSFSTMRTRTSRQPPRPTTPNFISLQRRDRLPRLSSYEIKRDKHTYTRIAQRVIYMHPYRNAVLKCIYIYNDIEISASTYEM